MFVRDPVALAQRLVRRPSIAPLDSGAFGDMEAALQGLGFKCHRWFSDPAGENPVDILYARLGEDAPHLCFGGHLDVAPVGDEALWSDDPFSAVIADGVLKGRGAADMKGAIGAFVAAVSRLIADSGPPAGSLSVLLTGGGWAAVSAKEQALGDRLALLNANFDHGLIGAPTARDRAGDAIALGRSGVVLATLTVEAAQDRAGVASANANGALVSLLGAATAEPFDAGDAPFPPSEIVVTALSSAPNSWSLAPARAEASLTMLHNRLWSDRSLVALLEKWLDQAGADLGLAWSLETKVLSAPFLCGDPIWAEFVVDAAAGVSGAEAARTAGGPPASAALLAPLCPTIEIGLPVRPSHRVDEAVSTADIEILSDIYLAILKRYYAR
ncbi:MAG: M20/M25/M40 family metallo-hydrolase [Pseudomonadota bacterium]